MNRAQKYFGQWSTFTEKAAFKTESRSVWQQWEKREIISSLQELIFKNGKETFVLKFEV